LNHLLTYIFWCYCRKRKAPRLNVPLDVLNLLLAQTVPEFTHASFSLKPPSVRRNVYRLKEAIDKSAKEGSGINTLYYLKWLDDEVLVDFHLDKFTDVANPEVRRRLDLKPA